MKDMKKYNIIYADPPWTYADMKWRDPSMWWISYPTMSLQEIKCLPIHNISEKDCWLFLWATMPLLKEALEVWESWWFRYITCAFTWVKKNPKWEWIYSWLWHWTNWNAELCLFFKKWSPSRHAKNVKQICLAPRWKHSAKPSEIRDRIVSLMWDLPRVELFARDKVEWWDSWWNEIESDIIF